MITLRTRALRILDFDTEARPLSWYGGEWVTKEVTAIAAQYVGEKRMYCWALGETDSLTMLKGFRQLYDAADIVTGHYIVGYDLPVLNGAMLEFGLPPLEPKLTQDTKTGLMRFSGLSKSQENLGALLGLKHPKIGMNQATWREANRLTQRGIRLTKQRVKGDVRQHMELREELLRRGMLAPPRLWQPKSGYSPAYHA